MKHLILTALLLTVLSTCIPHNNIDWQTDIDVLKTELPKKHYNLFMVKSQQDFNNGLDKFYAQKEQFSDFEMAVKLQQLIASMGDLHTALSLKPFLNFNRTLPLGLMWFSDGIFVQQTSKDNEELLGCKLLKINGTPMHTIIDSLSTLTTIDNEATVKKTIPHLLPAIQFLEYFGFANSDAVILQVENTNGEILKHTVHPERMNRGNMVKVIPDPIPLCYQNQSAFFWDQIQKEDNMYYIQYNQCRSREHPSNSYKGDAQKLPSFNEFRAKVIETITQNNFDRIIFDLRFNGGGNSDQGTELIKKLATIKKANKKGKLYVIIGRKTFSSAIINAMDFRNMTQATFVGEETAGKPNHLGEIKTMKLPSSGLTVQYSTKYFEYSDKDLNTITPDHSIEPSFKDFKEGIDPVYEWIVNH